MIHLDFETDTNDQRLRQRLREGLHSGAATVVFTKKDGTQRQMRCTTCPALIPVRVTESQEPRRERRVNDDVMPVYDLDLAAWRSFRWDSIRTASLEENT